MTSDKLASLLESSVKDEGTSLADVKVALVAMVEELMLVELPFAAVVATGDTFVATWDT